MDSFPGTTGDRSPGLLAVPERAGARLLARHARSAWFGGVGASDPEGMVTAIGWTMRWSRMGAADGGVDALLVPLAAGGFCIVVDPDEGPPSSRNPHDGGARFGFRVAHEVAHSFFFTDETPPERLLPHSAAEELFCDEFAKELIALLTPEPQLV